MCAICAMVAATGVAGTRSYLQSRPWSWLTPKRLRRITIGLFVAGLLASMVVISGSTPSHSPSDHQPVASQAAR
jgi:hypothetical protein